MNIFVPQNEQTRIECEEIVSTEANFLSGQSSTPMLSIKQDGMTGGLILTLGRVKIPKHIFNDCISFEGWDINFIISKMNHIKLVHKKIGLFDKELEICKKNYPNLPLKEVEKMAEENLLYTGHSLFSMLLPNDFEYFCNNFTGDDENSVSILGVNEPVYITRGVLISGTLSKKAMGSASGSLMHHICKDYGNKRAIDFVSYFQMLINNWLPHYGFTIGVKDCITKEESIVKKIIDEAMLSIYTIMESQKDPDLLELEIINALNNALKEGNSKVRDSFEKDNSFVKMIYSGAKGKAFQITQIGGLVGQQNVTDKRIQKNFGGRTLPHFVKYSNLQNAPDIIPPTDDFKNNLNVMLKLTESRGFIRRSYYRGISPVDLFFQSASAREGLIDSNAKTPDTGYIQRKLTKVIEDLKWSYNNTIVNSKNTILDFSYGYDNLDPAKMISVKPTPTSENFSFIDIKHTAECLNKNFEWNNYLESLKHVSETKPEVLSKDITQEVYKEIKQIEKPKKRLTKKVKPVEKKIEKPLQTIKETIDEEAEIL
jgi:DNA-directed RNA polymerase II subunit RPB1